MVYLITWLWFIPGVDGRDPAEHGCIPGYFLSPGRAGGRIHHRRHLPDGRTGKIPLSGGTSRTPGRIMASAGFVHLWYAKTHG